MKFITAFLLALVASSALAQVQQDARIGFSEDFNSVEGWSSADRFEKVQTVNGVGVWDTYVGSISSTKPPEQPFALGATTKATKEYDQDVDLDRYHYLVIKTDARQGLLEVELCGRETHVGYTTGVVAQDISELGISGKQKIRLTLQMMNTGQEFKFDYVRLVSELTDEEKAGLIASPIKLYKENNKVDPYQGLAALWARASRPARAGVSEMAILRDTATDMPIWRMTATPAHEGLKGADQPMVWWPDGSIMNTPRRGWYFETQQFGPRSVYKDACDIEVGRETVTFKARDASGNWQSIHSAQRIECESIVTGIAGRRMMVAFIGKEVLVVDSPADLAIKPAVKTIALPPGSCKGGGLSRDGKVFSYNNPWGSYRKVRVFLDENRWDYGAIHTFTHGMHGDPISVMTYTANAKAVISDDADAVTPGKDIRLLAVYKDSIATDYGQMTHDCRYGITNGMRGELAGQYLMFDPADSGTILRICTYNTSYSTWDVRAKVKASPDYTKLAYASDMLGWADYYLAVMRMPDAPTGLKVAATDGIVDISWQKPARAQEILGYNIYRLDAGRMTLLNKEPVKDCSYKDITTDGQTVHYVVTSVERSGLASVPSLPAGVTPADIVHIEAEDLPRTLPMREWAGGQASNLRAVRVTPVRETEKEGTITLKVPQGEGGWTVWVRACRAPGAKVSEVQVRVDGKNVASLYVEAGWNWQPVPISVTAGSTLELASSDAGLAIDKLVIARDTVGKVHMQTADDRLPEIKALAALTAKASGPGAIELTWSSSDQPDVLLYSVHVGDKPDFRPSNATLLVSTPGTSAGDWGLPAGKTFYYKVQAVDRWMRAGPASEAVSASVAALESRVSKVGTEKAKLDEGLVATEADGMRWVSQPKDAPKAAAMTLPFDVPAAGQWYLWVALKDVTDTNRIEVELDGKNLRRLSTPIGKEGLYIYRLQTQTDCYQLTSGEHKLKLTFMAPGAAAAVGALWLSNDPAFAPEGYNPQAMFETPPSWPATK